MPAQPFGVAPTCKARRGLRQHAPATVLLFALGAASGPGADRPQWGEAWSRNMVSAEQGLPDSFDPEDRPEHQWTADLGTETHATPVIARGRVFIGTNNGKPRDPRHEGDRGVLLCLDEATGRFLWQLVVPKIKNSMFWDWPSAGICSPATVEGDRVYLVSNRGEVMCLDVHGMANGNDGPYRDEARHSVPPGADARRARPGRCGHPLAVRPGSRNWACASTIPRTARVMVHGAFLYVNTSNGVDDSHKKITAPDAPSLIVLDKATGRLVATDDEHIGPSIFHCTWSSPALAEVNGAAQILFCGGDGVVYAFEPVASLDALKRHPATRAAAPSHGGEGGVKGLAPRRDHAVPN